MKIENYPDKNGYSLDTFTFPINPRIFDDEIQSNLTFKNIPYSQTHIAITDGGINPKSIVLTGVLFGSTKRDDFNTLAKHVIEKKLKKLYFADDRFYIVLGKSLKQTNSGGRTNIIDYVANFVAPVGILFGDTQKSASFDYGTATWTNGTLTNDGTTTTFIEKIVFTFGGSGSSGDTITIADNHSNGIQITLPAYTSSDTLTLWFVTLASIGTSSISGTSYWYADFVSGSTHTELTRSTLSGKNSINLLLDVSERIDTLTFGGTADIDTATVYFRNGYMG